MSDTDGVSVSRLICLVQERPVLWDRQAEVYKNRKLTRKAWNEICEALIDNYEDLSEHEKKAIGKNVLGKWANLRDNWLRYWRKRRDLLRVGSSTESLKKYIHHDQLLFLSKVYEPEIQQEVEEIQVDVDVISDPDEESPLPLSVDETSQNQWNVPEELIRFSMQIEPQPERHVYFFHSIMPMICDFDDGQTLEFHSAVLDSIRNIKYRESYANRRKFMYSFPQEQQELAPNRYMYSTATKNSCTGVQSSEMFQRVNTNERHEEAEVKATDTYKEELDCFEISSEAKKEEKLDHNPILSEPVARFNKSDSGPRNLTTVVNKLEKISKPCSDSSVEDTYDEFGKYIVSLLRKKRLSQKKVGSLKKKVEKDIFQFKNIQKRKSRVNPQRKPKSRRPDVKVLEDTSTTVASFAVGDNSQNDPRKEDSNHSMSSHTEASSKPMLLTRGCTRAAFLLLRNISSTSISDSANVQEKMSCQ